MIEIIRCSLAIVSVIMLVLIMLMLLSTLLDSTNILDFMSFKKLKPRYRKLKKAKRKFEKLYPMYEGMYTTLNISKLNDQMRENTINQLKKDEENGDLTFYVIDNYIHIINTGVLAALLGISEDDMKSAMKPVEGPTSVTMEEEMYMKIAEN